MKNKKLFIIPVLILLIAGGIFIKNTIENKKQLEIYNEKTRNYNIQIDNFLSTYSNSGFIISNTSNKFKYVRDERQDKVFALIPTIFDFNVEHKNEFKKYNESKIDFLFANNKMTYVFDAIINSNEDTIYKYLFINYLQDYSKKYSQKIHPKLT